MTTIRHISYALPDRVVHNDELAAENPTWDMSSTGARAGVITRHIAEADETAYDVAVRACEALFAETGLRQETVDALVFCTQSPDYVMPGNAHLLHGYLGLGDSVLAFDYNLACSGYVYGLAFADAFIARGLASEILLVTADTYSKHIHPKDRSARVLFGDGAAVTHLSRGDGEGPTVVAAELGSHGADFAKFYVPAGGMRRPSSPPTQVEETDASGNVRTPEQIHMDGIGVWSFVNSAVPPHVRAFVENQSLTFDDIDLFVFHQASQMTLDSLAKVLELPAGKVYVNMASVGNLVSASIPVALRMALDDGAVRPGMRVLLCGFGVGLSYGSVLLET
jgi:3-oxoacyl-[acyl-carrier-protein] synthase-3